MPKHLYFFIISLVFSGQVFAQNTDNNIENLVSFFESPNLQITAQNLQVLDSKSKQLPCSDSFATSSDWLSVCNASMSIDIEWAFETLSHCRLVGKRA